MKRTLSTLVVALFGATALAKDCTAGGKAPVDLASCFVGGCSSQLCTDDPGIISTCEWRNEYICYSDATCERQKNGKCGWTQTKELRECLKNPPQPSEPEPRPSCYIGGCSGQVCSEDADVVTDCMWRDEYICYESAVCERQRNGECGWTSTRDLEDCLANPPQPSEPEPHPGPDYCYITGCSGQLCSNEPAGMVTTCEWRDEYLCYQGARCERQRDGQCGWTNTSELRDCLANPPSEIPPEPTNQCFVGGCSSQLCTDDPNAVSTCEWTDSYACYADATCERQRDGQCGWTNTAELRECLENPPSTAV